MADTRLVLVTRKTRLEELVLRYNTVGQAKFYIEHLGQDFSDYLAEHDTYRLMADRIGSRLSRGNSFIQVERNYLSSFTFSGSDIVYVLGQDGLVANTLKYLDGQPVLGINPDPDRWIGVLLPYAAEDAALKPPAQLVERSRRDSITLASVKTSDGQELLAVNDFFIGQRSHVSSRYEIRHAGKSERQSSSGIIVSTGLGSTGWLKSVVAGATRIATGFCGGIEPVDDASFPRDSPYLKFAVREPYISPTSGAGIVFGRVSDETPLEIVSGMSGSGVIFSDGMEEDYLEFTSGVTARVGVSNRKAVVLSPE